jgi:hypothetical protein
VNTERRIEIYTRDGQRPLTARQRRRVVKKAGRDPNATVVRDNGMGYPASMQGYREIIGVSPAARPVSGAPVGASREPRAMDVWLDEPY